MQGLVNNVYIMFVVKDMYIEYIITNYPIHIRLYNISDITCVSFQSPYNSVSYSIIGDDAAPGLFTISPSSGMISYLTNANVGIDSTSFYRVC